MKTLLVTDDPESWAFLKSSTEIVNAYDYLYSQQSFKQESTQVINLCRSYQYQSIGYYVSLFAEARLHQVKPMVIQIQDTLNTGLYPYFLNDINEDIQKSFQHIKGNTHSIDIYFGQSMGDVHQDLVKKLHFLFPIPLITIEFSKQNQWTINSLLPLSIDKIPKSQINFVQEAAFQYFNNIIDSITPPRTENQKKPPQLSKKTKAYNLAILIEPDEGETAPSNQKAIENFVIAGESLGFNVDILTQNSTDNIMKYDALFIRTTTSVNNYTYQLARCAEQGNLVVIDDPQSIIKCTNKIFLAELFKTNDILTPNTQFITKYDKVLPPIEFPCVLKKPDSFCSQGVIKLDNMNELNSALVEFFKTSDILLIQPFMYTEFDWRIGIIDNKPLYVCRYYMAKDHWQIVDWNHDDAMIHDSILVNDTPKEIIDLALKSTALIGNGLYGVDIKSTNNKHYVIEINDNPSINCGIEDALIKSDLYKKIMSVFLERIEQT